METYYIFCEGKKTEPNYFEGFVRYADPEQVKINCFGPGKETLRILEFAQNYIRKNEIKQSHIWLVFDRDDFVAKNFDETIQKVKELDQKRKGGNTYRCARSNECFELWILLHFSYYQTLFHRDEYIRLLKKIFRKHGYFSYQKKQRDLFEIVLKIGDPHLAVQSAKKLALQQQKKKPSQARPCTYVFELVLELACYLPEEMRARF